MIATSASSRLIVRPMSADDIDRAMQIASSLPTAPHWPRDIYEDAIAENAITPRLALVAQLQDRLAGFAIASIVAGESELESIAIANEFQRTGIASKLLQHLITHLQNLAVKRFILEVRQSNIRAQQLYLKTGFTQTHRRREYYHSPEEDALIFELPLPPKFDHRSGSAA